MGLPPRPFLYTLDQIAQIVSLSTGTLARSYIFYAGRTTGLRSKNQMRARNIAAAEDKPEWRVAEEELIRWMKVKGYRYHERGWLES